MRMFALLFAWLSCASLGGEHKKAPAHALSSLLFAQNLVGARFGSRVRAISSRSAGENRRIAHTSIARNRAAPEMRWDHDGTAQPMNAVQYRFEGISGVTAMPQNQFPALSKYHRLPYILCNPEDEQVLGYYNMVYPSVGVERVQCMLRVQPQGELTLIGLGNKGPTLWREPGGQWNALYKGQQATIMGGDQVSLDCNNPDSAVFECFQENVADAYQRGQGYGQQGGVGQQQGGYYDQQQGGYYDQGTYDQQQGGYQQQGSYQEQGSYAQQGSGYY